MGHSINIRIVILIAILIVAGFFTSFTAQTEPYVKSRNLSQVLEQINGWDKARSNPLESNILAALELDDYIYTTYRRNNRIVNLYIGYYQSPEKIGAAHDPLVCFSGQGWTIGDLKTGQTTIKHQKIESIINYSSMIANKAAQRELIIYWFQVDDKTSSGTFGQKIKLLLAKATNRSGENAFVRISSSIEKESVEVVLKEIIEFSKSFYPTFLNYVINK